MCIRDRYVEERYASELIAAQGGALGYLLKDRVADVAEFLDSVTRIAQGATVLDPEVVAQLLSLSLIQISQLLQRFSSRS